MKEARAGVAADEVLSLVIGIGVGGDYSLSNEIG